MNEEAVELREPASYRFRCECGAERDQRVRRSASQFIRCVCGNQATRVTESPPTPERINWWRDARGKDVGYRFGQRLRKVRRLSRIRRKIADLRGK